MELTEEQLERYSRHINLKEIGMEGQKRLLTSSVLVVGAGGLGSPVCMYLAAAGIGTIGIVDADEVDLSNLQRQIIHSTDKIGIPKVESAAERIKSINPSVRVKTYREMLTSSNAEYIIKDYDCVVDATDNFEAKFLINDTCVSMGKAFVHGGILRFGGQLMTYVPGKGPCYRCVFKEPPAMEDRPTCKEMGIIGAMPGTIGSLQALEVVKYLTGAGENLTGYLLNFDALTMSFRRIKLPKQACACEVCRRSGNTW